MNLGSDFIWFCKEFPSECRPQAPHPFLILIKSAIAYDVLLIYVTNSFRCCYIDVTSKRQG